MNISARTRARAPAMVKWPSTEWPPSYIALFSNFIKSLRRHRHELWVRLGVGCWVCQAIYSYKGSENDYIKKEQFVWGKKVGKLEKAGSDLGGCLEKKDKQGGLESHCDRLSTKLTLVMFKMKTNWEGGTWNFASSSL